LPLSGVGINPAGPAISLAQRSAAFGAVQVGTTYNVPVYFSVSNPGQQAATLAFAPSADFVLDTTRGTCGASLPAASACIFGVTFAPTTAGAKTGTLTITSNAPGSPFVVSLSGTAIVVPRMSFSPVALDFGAIGVNTTSPSSAVVLHNGGNGSVAIAGITTSAPFALANGCAPTLAAGASCTLTITAQPTTSGRSVGQLLITDDAPGQRRVVGLSVNGVTGPALQLTPASVDFGSQPRGSTSASRALTIANTGTAAADLSGVITNGDFTQTGNCPASLAAGASCVSNVAFRPTLVTDPIKLIGYVAVGGSFAGSPRLALLQGVGTPATGAVTTTTLTASPNPSNTGQAVTLTASVASASAGTPTGTVAFLEGSTTLGSGTLGASATATLSLSSLASGSHPISAQYSGDAQFSGSTSTTLSQQVNAVVAAPDFSLAASPSTLTTSAGVTVTSTLSATPLNGSTQTLSFSCSGLPAGASCSFAPASLSLNGNTVSTTVVSIASLQRSAALLPRSAGPMQASLAPPPDLWFPAAVALAALGLRRRRAVFMRGPVSLGPFTVVGLLSLWLLAACSSGGSHSGGVTTTPGTPAGSYAVQVVATAGASQKTTTLTLIVQ
jgi:hypothetical protein